MFVINSWFFGVLPILAVGIAIARSQRKHSPSVIREFFLTTFAGVVGGLVLSAIYAHAESRQVHNSFTSEAGHVPVIQVLVTCYWGAAVAVLLRAINSFLAWGIGWLVPRNSEGKPCCASAVVAASVVRAALVLAVMIPLVGAMMILYRPHVVYPGTPTSLLGVDFEEVRFSATDGVGLRGWWIPAARNADTDDEHSDSHWAQWTVILCHGFSADKASELRLVRDLVPNGYNVLAFDFRGYGESGGQLTTFGDLERRDVLGAVRWALQTHPSKTKRVFGLGEGLGAAALIGAAADSSPEGQAISAVALLSPYDRLTGLVQDIARENMIPRAGWMANHVSLPVTGAVVGRNLVGFSPVQEIDKIAPRPVLVIGAEEDRMIDVWRSREVYEQASQPKYAYWMKKGSHQQMLFGSWKVSLTIRIFFETAREVL